MVREFFIVLKKSIAFVVVVVFFLEKEGKNMKSYRDQIKEGHDHRLCYLRTKLTNGIDPDATNFDKS